MFKYKTQTTQTLQLRATAPRGGGHTWGLCSRVGEGTPLLVAGSCFTAETKGS